MSNMVGIGPFITIPMLMATMGGPQAMLGWFLAALVTIPDSMVWSELGAAMPGSGGSYVYLREGFGPRKWGRFMAYMFIWQFIFSGPLEIASGYIGFASYLGYVWKGMERWQVIAVAMGVVVTALIQSALGGIGLWVAGVPFASLLTAVMLLLAIAQIGVVPVLACALAPIAGAVSAAAPVPVAAPGASVSAVAAFCAAPVPLASSASALTLGLPSSVVTVASNAAPVPAPEPPEGPTCWFGWLAVPVPVACPAA